MNAPRLRHMLLLSAQKFWHISTDWFGKDSVLVYFSKYQVQNHRKCISVHFTVESQCDPARTLFLEATLKNASFREETVCQLVIFLWTGITASGTFAHHVCHSYICFWCNIKLHIADWNCTDLFILDTVVILLARQDWAGLVFYQCLWLALQWCPSSCCDSLE